MICTPDIGSCVLCVAQLEVESRNKSGDNDPAGNLSWTCSIDKEIRAYRAEPNRLWKFMLFQKDTMKNFDLVLSDADFQNMYSYFSKREKEFYDLFRPDLSLRKEAALRCLSILGQKISVQRTDTGSIMVIDALRRPNPVIEEVALYIPIKEFMRQKTIMGEKLQQGPKVTQTQYCTNARQTVLQTASKFAGRYLHVTVYFMVPLSITPPRDKA